MKKKIQSFLSSPWIKGYWKIYYSLLNIVRFWVKNGKPEFEDVFSLECDDYVAPMTEASLPVTLLPKYDKHKQLAEKLGYNGIFAWKVKGGFALSYHAVRAGPCNKHFLDIDELNLKDEETADCYVFWIPRIIPESLNKTSGQMRQLLDNLRDEYDLPEYHLCSFGDAELLGALILKHFQLTGEQVPLKYEQALTDTVTKDGKRVYLSFMPARGLYVGIPAYNNFPYPIQGCFPISIETVH